MLSWFCWDLPVCELCFFCLFCAQCTCTTHMWMWMNVWYGLAEQTLAVQKPSQKGREQIRKGEEEGWLCFCLRTMPPRRERYKSLYSRPHQQHHDILFLWLDMHPPKPPIPQWDFQTVPLRSGVKSHTGAAAWCASNRGYVFVSKSLSTLHKMHNFSPFSLRFSASVLFCSLCYVTEVDTWSFLACLDSFACSFLVCFLQHYEAELSMLQSSRVCNSTAQNKTSATFSLELGVTANLSDLSGILQLCNFLAWQAKPNWLLYWLYNNQCDYQISYLYITA